MSDSSGLGRGGRFEGDSEVYTEWDSVTRRYRRGLGGWWWLALLLIPLLLAGIGLGLGDDDATASDGPAATPTTAIVQTSPPETTAASTVPSPFSISRSGDSITVTAKVPDEAAKTALLDAVRSSAGDATVVDKVTVEPGAVSPPLASIGPALAAAAGAGDFGVDWDGTTLTLKGQAPSEAAKSAAETVAKSAFPTGTVDNQITVVAAPSPTAGAGCDTLAADVKAITDQTKITFNTAGSALSAASAKAVADIAAKLKACSDAKVTVAGHTDSQGAAAANQSLSERRANIVKAALVKGGVPEASVTATGHGETKPVASNDTATGMAANRRVEITVE